MLSPEVQSAVDEIRRNKSLTESLLAANALLGEKIADLRSKVDAIPAKQPLSAEDKAALQAEVAALDDLNDRLESATQANTEGGAIAGAAPGYVAPTPPEHNIDAPRPDPIAGTGNNGTVPLMPNMAFDPAGGVSHGPGDAGQPNQPAAIETAGGFVVSGGGNTARAPGSRPDSPSSSVVIPNDPNAKAPASTADEAKSGLGDSSQNALLGPDGEPSATGPGTGFPGKPDPAVGIPASPAS